MPRPASVTLHQVAENLQISMRTAYRRVQDGTIPAYKIGTLWRCPLSYLVTLSGQTMPPVDIECQKTPYDYVDEPDEEGAGADGEPKEAGPAGDAL